uniref:DUF4167 domain-containing protein n=1 Tax=Xinfangfangia pollutisoli TaxID=2865960 RepID=UPI001CD489EE
MRSSKKRSRSNQNRPRTLGNIINRVFDSSGPEGKVRGTPQQIIEKYQMLARDAQLSNDRVAAENFLQHAEHYTRLLAEAQREMAAEQEARQQQYQQNGGNPGNGGQGNGGNGGNRDYRERDRNDQRGEPRNDNRDRAEPRGEYRDPAGQDQPDLVDVIETEAGDSGLVETPEARRQRPQDDRPRNDRRDENRNEPRNDARNEARNEPRNERRDPDRREGERKERGEPRRDRDDRRRAPAAAETAAQPELPAFITGIADP